MTSHGTSRVLCSSHCLLIYTIQKSAVQLLVTGC